MMAVVYSEVKNMKAIENMKNTYHMPNPFIKAALTNICMLKHH